MFIGELMEDLAIPYVLVMDAIPRDGTWVRRAEYPELPGCVVEAQRMIDVLEQIDALRIRIIIEMRERGERPPRPRPPLKVGLPSTGLDLDKYSRALLEEAHEGQTN